MKKPPKRPEVPERRSDHDRRRLHPAPAQRSLLKLRATAVYHGSPKHKEHPHRFGLPPFQGNRGDETLCDTDANFQPDHMAGVPAMLKRGIDAGLISEAEQQGIPRILWSVGDDGWIYEARISNSTQADYHGYPVMRGEAIAEAVYERFAAWADTGGSATGKAAAARCKTLYGFAS